MKKAVLLSAVIFTVLTVQSCRQSDDMLSPDEAATLQKVLKSSNDSADADGDQGSPAASILDGETVPPPKK